MPNNQHDTKLGMYPDNDKNASYNNRTVLPSQKGNHGDMDQDALNGNT